MDQYVYVVASNPWGLFLACLIFALTAVTFTQMSIDTIREGRRQKRFESTPPATKDISFFDRITRYRNEI